MKKKADVEEDDSGYSWRRPERGADAGAAPARAGRRGRGGGAAHAAAAALEEEEPSEARPNAAARSPLSSEIEDSRKGWFGNVHGGRGRRPADDGRSRWCGSSSGSNSTVIFFYPPVLFIIGLVAFVKGLTGGD